MTWPRQLDPIMARNLAIRSYGLFVLFFVLSMLPTIVRAQGYAYENFSQGTVGKAPTAADLSSSWYGSAGAATSVSNSTGALTYTNSSVCGTMPADHTGLILDYDTTLGSGTNDQIIYMDWPTSGSSVVSQIEFYFCSDILIRLTSTRRLMACNSFPGNQTFPIIIAMAPNADGKSREPIRD